MRRQPRPDRRSGDRPGRGPSGEAAEHALSFEQAWERFAYYIEKVCELQATEPAVADVVSGRYPAADCLMAVCGRAQDSGTRIIERTQLAGAVRRDFTVKDLLLFFGTNALLARAVADTTPVARRRQVGFLLDGLSAETAQEAISVVPLTPQRMYDVMGRLAAP
ncbi:MULTISPECIES: SbtR family transcriptional regulator [unclassified Streptomyces]|uniref:SbtR family transcriptional regulator n=1 Tax=Streptomyces sp. NPDC055082 TaxID=3365718 RepID=UPI0037D4FE4F